MWFWGRFWRVLEGSEVTPGLLGWVKIKVPGILGVFSGSKKPLKKVSTPAQGQRPILNSQVGLLGTASGGVHI